jgi:hypothetical protein
VAFNEQDRVFLRTFLGFGGIFHQADPRLENAITSVQSVADGGTRPDSSTENFVKARVYGQAAVVGPPAIPALRGLLQIEANIATLDVQAGARKAGKVDLDSFREMIRLRREGRRMAATVAYQLGMRGVRADVFSAAPVITDDDPFATALSPFW